MPAARWEARARPPLAPLLYTSGGPLGVGLREAFSKRLSNDLTRRVLAARAEWTEDFGGEQFSLGRAFYTHLETGRSRTYFENARASDAIVEAALPGAQDRLLALLAAMTGGTIRRRRGFCGPGVHVFPAGEKVATEGGVIHFDTEGLTPRHLERGARAVTLVLMLAAPARGGGLVLWPVRYRGHDTPTRREVNAPHRCARYRAGDALLIDSYRLHQIERFGGAKPRIAFTVHAAEVDQDCWEAWF